MATKLEFITAHEVTSTVTSINIDNVFSAEYDNYVIYARGLQTAGSTATYHMQLLQASDGSVVSNTNYTSMFESCKTNSSFGESRNASNSSGWIEFFGDPDLAPEGSGTVGRIYNPFASDEFTYCTWRSQHAQGGSTNRFYYAAGVFIDTTSFRGFKVSRGLANDLTAGNFEVYGIAK